MLYTFNLPVNETLDSARKSKCVVVNLEKRSMQSIKTPTVTITVDVVKKQAQNYL